MLTFYYSKSTLTFYFSILNRRKKQLGNWNNKNGDFVSKNERKYLEMTKKCKSLKNYVKKKKMLKNEKNVNKNSPSYITLINIVLFKRAVWSSVKHWARVNDHMNSIDYREMTYFTS